MAEIVKTELLTEGLVEIPHDSDPGGTVRRSVRKLWWRLRRPAPRQPEFLDLFAANMSAYRFESAAGAVAIVPFHNALSDDRVPIEAECRKLGLLELERAERHADMQTQFPGVISRAVAGGSDDYAGSA